MLFSSLVVQVYLKSDCLAIFSDVLHYLLVTLNSFNVHLYFHFRMTQKKIPMMAASHPKDDAWAQGTVLGAVKLLVKTLGNTFFPFFFFKEFLLFYCQSYCIV